MSVSIKKFTACLAGIALTLLTACGGQSTTDTLTTSGATSQTSQTLSSTANGQTNATKLLDSLAVLYPNGQLPANRTAQAAIDLGQNPAALKLTAETATTAKGQSTANTPIAAQAVTADYQPVQRVQNTTLYGAYFFSIYPTEVNNALATNPNWRLEGPAFWASLATGTDLYPVHRFRNKTNGSYLYSIYGTEQVSIITNYADTFEHEGIAWYARQTPATGWSALYRFRNKTNGTYLFSAYESEKDAIVATYPDVFALEGIAYYVRQDGPATCTPAVIGSTAYSLVFKGCSAANVAEYYDKTECVRDNATGLIWQGQTPAGTGLRANDQYKTNYDSTTELQKWNGDTPPTFRAPTAAEVNAATNSIGFKNAVNATNLCGSSAWRLPTKDELFGIVKSNPAAPMIDTDWFPNTKQYGWYWTSSPYPGYANAAWYVYFDGGIAGVVNRGAYYDQGDYGYGRYSYLVRLVR